MRFIIAAFNSHKFYDILNFLCADTYDDLDENVYLRYTQDKLVIFKNSTYIKTFIDLNKLSFEYYENTLNFEELSIQKWALCMFINICKKYQNMYDLEFCIDNNQSEKIDISLTRNNNLIHNFSIPFNVDYNNTIQINLDIVNMKTNYDIEFNMLSSKLGDITHESYVLDCEIANKSKIVCTFNEESIEFETQSKQIIMNDGNNISLTYKHVLHTNENFNYYPTTIINNDISCEIDTFIFNNLKNIDLITRTLKMSFSSIDTQKPNEIYMKMQTIDKQYILDYVITCYINR